jgi:hypothetical protein
LGPLRVLRDAETGMGHTGGVGTHGTPRAAWGRRDAEGGVGGVRDAEGGVPYG